MIAWRIDGSHHGIQKVGREKVFSDYRIRISDSKRSGEFIYTDFFRVKPKIPLAVKVFGIAAVGGGIFLAISSGGGAKAGDDEDLTGIPSPPSLPIK